jgi:Dyp-type peroxidase family
MVAGAVNRRWTMLSEADRADIQGILTTGYGHLEHSAYVFVRFADGAAAAAWLDALVPQVRSAAPWGRGKGKVKPTETTNVALTYAGLQTLGIPDETRRTLPVELVEGMPSRAAVLGDRGGSAPEHWELGAPAETIHALVIVHADERDTLDARVAEVEAAIGAAGELAAPVQTGRRQPGAREHFGFANDGISQPRIEGLRQEDVPGPWVMRRGEFILGHLNELELYPSSPAVAAANDPDGILPRFPGGYLPEYRDLGRNGSYLVYRKLEQDVASFWSFMQEHCERGRDAATLEADMAALAAKCMGRWPSGAPLVLSPDRDEPGQADDNTFMYRASDELGLRCPLGAHIRRANPRDGLKRIRDTREQALQSVNQHRLLRRGMAYGERAFEPNRVAPGHAPRDLAPDGKPRGLHFVAVGADTKRQFEFVQQTWLNNPRFSGLYGDKDPVVGDNDDGGRATLQRRPVRTTLAGIPRFVTVRGGAYFFLPGMTALRYLAQRR